MLAQESAAVQPLPYMLPRGGLGLAYCKRRIEGKLADNEELQRRIVHLRRVDCCSPFDGQACKLARGNILQDLDWQDRIDVLPARRLLARGDHRRVQLQEVGEGSNNLQDKTATVDCKDPVEVEPKRKTNRLGVKVSRLGVEQGVMGGLGSGIDQQIARQFDPRENLEILPSSIPHWAR